MRVERRITSTDVRLTSENVTEIQRELDVLAREKRLTPGGILAAIRSELVESRVESVEPRQYRSGGIDWIETQYPGKVPLPDELGDELGRTQSER